MRVLIPLVATLLLFPVNCFAQFGFAVQQDVVSMYLFEGEDELTFKRNLEGRTALRMKRLAALVSLDKAQEKKFDLALKGDLNRFYREIADVREKTKGLNIQDQRDMQKAWEHISPLYEKVMTKGILGEGSLYLRVVDATLDEEQKAAYSAYLKDRNEVFRDAVLDACVAELEKWIPLLSNQRAQLREIFAKDWKKKYQNAGVALMGNARYTTVHNASQTLRRLDPKKLEKILDEQQFAAFERFRDNDMGVMMW